MAFVISALTDERLNPWKIVHPDQVDPADHHVVPVAAEILGDRAVHLDLVAVPLVAASHTETASPQVQVVRQVAVDLEAESQLDPEVDPLPGVQGVIAGEALQQTESRAIAHLRVGIVRGVIGQVLIGRVMIVMAQIVRVLIVVPRVIARVGIVRGVIGQVAVVARVLPAARCLVVGAAMIVQVVIARRVLDQVRIVLGEGGRIQIVTPRIACGRNGQVRREFPMTLQQRTSILAC